MYLAGGVEQSRAPQGFVLWAGPPLGAQPMWSAVGIQGRTPHKSAYPSMGGYPGASLYATQHHGTCAFIIFFFICTSS